MNSNLNTLKTGELLKINWNRMSELLVNPRNKLSDQEKVELSCRINIQNGFSIKGNKEKIRDSILWLNDKTKIKTQKYLNIK